MKICIKASTGLSRYFRDLNRMRSVYVMDDTGRNQQVIRYVSPETNESFALIGAGNNKYQFVKIEKADKDWQIVEVIDEGTL